MGFSNGISEPLPPRPRREDYDEYEDSHMLPDDPMNHERPDSVDDAEAEAKREAAAEFHPDCPLCMAIRERYAGFGPSHNGSKNCESGSIASGGKNAHCSCDTCF